MALPLGGVFVGLLAWFSAGLIQRILVGAGLALTVGVGLNVALEEGLNQAVNHLSGVGGLALDFARLFGIGDALSIVGSALVARVWWLLSTKMLMGVRKS